MGDALTPNTVELIPALGAQVAIAGILPLPPAAPDDGPAIEAMPLNRSARSSSREPLTFIYIYIYIYIYIFIFTYIFIYLDIEI